MSEDEFFALLVSLAAAVVGGLYWYWPCARVHWRACSAGARGVVMAAPVACAGLLLMVLVTLAASDVVTSPRYIFFYMVMGAAWVAIAARGFALLGISLRYDALERGNRAVLPALAGGLMGLTLCFAGGNIGDGPGWYVVLASCLLSTAGWYAVWLCLELLSGAAEHIGIDRDMAAGWRLGAFLVAAGLIFGRAVAGDWHSLAETIADFFRQSWPILVLLPMAIVIERVCRPTPQMPSPSVAFCGIVPALAYVALAVVWLAMVGFGR